MIVEWLMKESLFRAHNLKWFNLLCTYKLRRSGKARYITVDSPRISIGMSTNAANGWKPPPAALCVFLQPPWSETITIRVPSSIGSPEFKNLWLTYCNVLVTNKPIVRTRCPPTCCKLYQDVNALLYLGVYDIKMLLWVKTTPGWSKILSYHSGNRTNDFRNARALSSTDWATWSERLVIAIFK